MKNNKGITLIALIITVIIMLILVAVTINVVINSGIIVSAKNAAQKTENAYEEEAQVESKIKVGEEEQTLNEYLKSLTVPKVVEYKVVGDKITIYLGEKYNNYIYNFFENLSRSEKLDYAAFNGWALCPSAQQCMDYYGYRDEDEFLEAVRSMCRLKHDCDDEYIGELVAHTGAYDAGQWMFPGNGCPNFNCLICLNDLWLGILAPSVYGVESDVDEMTLDLSAGGWVREYLDEDGEAELVAELPSGETQVLTTLRFFD